MEDTTYIDGVKEDLWETMRYFTIGGLIFLQLMIDVVVVTKLM